MLDLIFFYIIRALEAIGVGIILLGIIKMLLVSARVFIHKIKHPQLMTEIRMNLSGYLILSLEVFIGRDIIETLLNPTLTEFFILVALVFLRTMLSFFLNYEVKHMPAPMLHKKLKNK